MCLAPRDSVEVRFRRTQIHRQEVKIRHQSKSFTEISPKSNCVKLKTSLTVKSAQETVRERHMRDSVTVSLSGLINHGINC